MITLVMQGDVLLHAAIAELPAEYFTPIFDKDKNYDFYLLRYIAEIGGWYKCTTKSGFNWFHVPEHEIPAAARLAGTLGG